MAQKLTVKQIIAIRAKEKAKSGTETMLVAGKPERSPAQKANDLRWGAMMKESRARNAAARAAAEVEAQPIAA